MLVTVVAAMTVPSRLTRNYLDGTRKVAVGASGRARDSDRCKHLSEFRISIAPEVRALCQPVAVDRDDGERLDVRACRRRAVAARKLSVIS